MWAGRLSRQCFGRRMSATASKRTPSAQPAASSARFANTVRITAAKTDGVLTIEVEDDGPGVPRDIRQKIFDPFFTTKTHSTGIGLSLCHRIITDHRGKLDIGVSELGGACFIVEFPLAQESVV